MLDIGANALLLLLVFLSFSVGYVIGTFTESEIEKIAERIHAGRLLTTYTVLAEILVVLVLFYIDSYAYTLVVAAIIIANIVLAAMHTAAKSDMGKMLYYGLLFFIATTVGSVAILAV